MSSKKGGAAKKGGGANNNSNDKPKPANKVKVRHILCEKVRNISRNIIYRTLKFLGYFYNSLRVFFIKMSYLQASN